MRDYENQLFHKIIELVNNEEPPTIDIDVEDDNMLALQFYLTRKLFYAVIIDDYPVEIVDKNSLLEAIYYQVKLITMHDLNWDAFEEALNDALLNFINFEGICLMFKNKSTVSKVSKELVIMTDIVSDINKRVQNKRIVLLINK